MKPLYKVMFEKHILSFDQLVLATFKELDLTALEAMALMKLHTLMTRKISLIKPSLFAAMVNVTAEEAEHLLNSLIEKGYLTIELSDEDGKSKEIFHLDTYVSAAFGVLDKEVNSRISSAEDALIAFIEETFQKPLIPTDLQALGAMLKNGHTIAEIKAAVLASVGSPYPSMKTIQKNLYKAPVKKYAPPQKDVLEKVKQLWEK